ncbi:MAG: ABC transporter ATP-binding protein [Firmicutes bacterium]|nr:ABC transporter ATP-binding protein [Bacillota bacterium]
MTYIQLEQVSFSWPRGEQVLKDINLAIEKHDTVALMGPNGSGKTTLGKLIIGLLAPSAGRVLLWGEDAAKYSLAARGRRIGYVFQNPERQFFASTVSEEIGFALKLRGMSPEEAEKRVGEMLGLFELEAYADTFPFNLSQGEKQRLALAAVFALNPEFIILDEPFSGLDWLRKQHLLAMLARVGETGVGYLLISHDEEMCARLCSRVLHLEGGELR